jgi:hypothetical protein
MPALFCPNLDSLRLTLASGLLPATVTSAPVRAGFDDHAHLWLEIDELPSRDILNALNRFGIVAHGSSIPITRPRRCWADLLPLRRTSQTGDGLFLFDLPDKRLAKFVSRLRRSGEHSLGIRLLPEPYVGRAWVTTTSPPQSVLLAVTETDSPIVCYRQQTARVWTAYGWEHPLADELAVPANHIALCRTGCDVAYFAGSVPVPESEELAIPRAVIPLSPVSHRVTVPVRLRLAPDSSPQRSCLWILSAAEAEQFHDFCQNADQSLLRAFQVADVAVNGESRLLVRRSPDDNASTILPTLATGYRPDSRLPSLFVPVGFSLRPQLRTNELARELQLSENHIVCVEPADEKSIATHSIALAAFRPLAEAIDYVAPRAEPLAPRIPATGLFALAEFSVREETTPEAEPESVITLPDEEIELLAEDETPTWVERSLNRMMRWVRGSQSPAPQPKEPTAIPAKRNKLTSPPRPGRVERKLSSADTLLHGHDRAAHRHALESRLLADFPQLSSDQRASRWAELANVYTATGQPLDASVCWMNAVWECATPPEDWLERWVETECLAAKRSEATNDLERWLGEPGRAGTGRVVAAIATRMGFQQTPTPEFFSAIPRVLTILDQQFEDIPLRSVWLARLAIARVCDGDVLGVARWRDRVIHRLRDRGPGLDLDEPSFLRFRGTATPERFQTARVWLTNVKESVLNWVQRQAGHSGLQWTGLEGEGEATAVYAQFLLAWGLGALGERARSRDWAARARKSLARAGGPRVDPAGHAFLGDLFLHRIKDAHEGHLPKPSLPNTLQHRLEHLPMFARYAVDRLREHCRILQPVTPARAYNGLDLKEFWGTDRLGERLSLLTSHTNSSHLHDEARELLELARKESTTATVPRVIFALLEVAGFLSPQTGDEILEFVPAALDWMEAWVQSGRGPVAERALRLTRYQSRMLSAAFAVANTTHATRLLQHITQRLATANLRDAVRAAAPSVFRCARKCGLISEAESLMRLLDPEHAETPNTPITTEGLGLAIGWFVANDEEAGNRILNAAREYLYLAATADLQNRTAIALAYAEALGFAPVGIALGRLEELFQRLDRIAVNGSTNCYFTLQPLRLIDTVVRSVVTDEFTLSAAVRSWLDEDEYLIRCRIHSDMTAMIRENEL